MSRKLWTIQEICREITHLYDADCNMPTRWSVYKLICKVRDTSQAVLEENRQMHTRIVKLEQQVEWGRDELDAAITEIKKICKVRDTMQAEVDAAAKREEVLKEKLARYIDDEIDHQEFLSPLVKQKELRAYYTELTGRQYGQMSDMPHIPLSILRELWKISKMEWAIWGRWDQDTPSDQFRNNVAHEVARLLGEEEEK